MCKDGKESHFYGLNLTPSLTAYSIFFKESRQYFNNICSFQQSKTSKIRGFISKALKIDKLHKEKITIYDTVISSEAGDKV